MNFLSLHDCLGLTPVTRGYHFGPGDINPATGKQYAVNPSTGHWDDNFYANTYGNAQKMADPIAMAREAQKMQIEANQPAIATLNQQKTDLDSKYDDLLKTITGQQKVAEDSQILATNNEMGRRGITADSGIAQQQQASSLRPITAQYQGLTAQTGLSRQQDIGNLATTIASLQAGNVPGALSFGNSAAGLQNQANSLAAQIAQNQAQNELESKRLSASTTSNNKDRYISIGDGLFDAQTGAIIQKPKSAGVGGGSNYGTYYNTPSSFQSFK